jgi:hypothetical protein
MLYPNCTLPTPFVPLAISGQASFTLSPKNRTVRVVASTMETKSGNVLRSFHHAAAVVYEAAIITTTPVQEPVGTIGRQAHAPKGPAQSSSHRRCSTPLSPEPKPDAFLS